MHLIINIILPMFAIILLGFVAERFNLLGKDAINVLNKFVYFFAMPVLIFGSMAIEPISKINNYKYLTGFTLGMFITFMLTFSVFKLRNKNERLSSISLKSLGASFPNAGYIGIPLLFAIAGNRGVLPAALASILSFTMMALSIFLIELDLNKDEKFISIMSNIALNLLKNPLIMSAILGILYSYCNLPFPDAADYFYHLFGSAAAPCALFAIGQTLSRHRLANLAELSLITCLKLILHPIVTFIVLLLLKVTPLWIMAGTILSGLPTAAVKYVIAERYHLYERESSSLILLSTLSSVITLSILMLIFHKLWPHVFRS